MEILIKKLTQIVLFITIAFQAQEINAQSSITISEKASSGAFPLTDCFICHDKSDALVVEKAVNLLANDIQMVTQIRLKVVETPAKGNNLIIGTLGKNKHIDRLVAEGKLNVDPIKNGWEQFVIKRISPDCMVIVGSDRRGTAYGVFSLSEAVGVSPWTWWADVPVVEHKALYVCSDFVSKTPSVKYRGIFINDEDWGLKPWSSNNYEKNLGDIGPKTYARVCELLLRLKGNMLAPAMHSCTGAFYSHPESKMVADSFAIIITTSHCEPLLFNNAAKSEWDKQRDGEWNYRTNKTTILKKMDSRVQEACWYENIYTMAMRGVHDEGLRGNLPPHERVKVLSEVMADQRDILQKYIGKPLADIPQIFVPYKETLDVYEMGLEVPEDITIVWPDDNYGYLKRLSNSAEQKRSGGSGVYYHLSYLGAPHDYLWLNTTPPVLMYEELVKAYKTGADRYWLLNVGDIKPAEMGIQTFFDLAWNVDSFDFHSVLRHQSRFLSGIYGKKYENKLQQILDDYYRLAWSRKPEFMGWEREWDDRDKENLTDTEFSFQNYNDAQQRMSDYKRISDKVKRILNGLSEKYKASFFEMIAYPVMASYQQNKKFMLAQLNHELHKTGDFAGANWAAQQSQQAFDSINVLNAQYNSLLDGKWRGMMMLAPGFVAKYQNMPELFITDQVGKKEMDLTPIARNSKLKRCAVIDFEKYRSKKVAENHTLNILEGLGYDWKIVQFGEATESVFSLGSHNASTLEYEFKATDADSVAVYISMLPSFPINKERGTRLGVIVDGQPMQVVQYQPKEYSPQWKTNVLRNGSLSVLKFKVSLSANTHTLSLVCIDPGVMVQRIIINWGGLKPTYVGPNLKR